jgi:hypothetical protein
MAKYKNVHTDSLSVGRYIVKPGTIAPELPLGEDEAADLIYFVEKGYLVLQHTYTEPAPEPKKRGKRKHADS